VAAEEADRSRALNILSLVTRAAFPAGRRRPPSMTELLAIVMSQRFINAAAEKIQGRHQHPTRVEIRLGPRQGSFSTATDDEITPEALRRQADDLAGQFASQIDAKATKQRDKLLRRARTRMIVGTAISGALMVIALVTSSATSPFAILSLGLVLGVLGYAALDRFVLLQARIQSIADAVRQEKSEIKSTLTQVSDELATLFSQEQRSRDLLPALQAYLLGLTAEDAHRAIRFTAPPPTRMLLGPDDSGTPADADPTATRDDGFARGFPEWTPWPPKRARQLPGPMAPPV
jgi:hypothetical protein